MLTLNIGKNNTYRNLKQFVQFPLTVGVSLRRNFEFSEPL